jgi:hypothetical protein
MKKEEDWIPEFQFNPCDKLPKYQKLQPACDVSELARSYPALIKIGSGSTAIMIGIIGQTKLAIKIIVFSQDAVNEILVSCAINKLQNESIIFNRIYGWTVCKTIPDVWKDKLRGQYETAKDLETRIETQSGRIMLIPMEMYYYRITDIIYGNQDAKKMLFLLIHGISVARRKFPYFRHGDIHNGNIMIKIRVELFPIMCKTSTGIIYSVENVIHVPKLIDFGQTTFSEKTHFSGNDMTHLKMVFLCFVKNIDREEFVDFFDSEEYKESEQTKDNDFEVLERLLDHSFFGYNKTKININQNICSLCSSSVAQYTYGTIEGICSQKCLDNSLGVLQYFIK